jgi:hypothetical protein
MLVRYVAMSRLVLQILLALLIASIAGSDQQAGEKSTDPTSRPAEGKTMNADRALVDEYLVKWDQFAQGHKQLAPYLRDNKQKFELALAQLLRTGHRSAPARLVFYPVVQVGGAIPSDSELGVAARAVLGADFPITTTKEGQKVLFCADLYSWWQKQQSKFEHFQTFDDWIGRDFAKNTVLPMYQRLQGQSR